MVTLQITKKQVFSLIDQLSPEEQKEILQYLIEKTGNQFDPDDTPDEIVIKNLKEGLKEAINGETIPLSQMWDLAVENQNGQLILIVEVKIKNNVSSEWAKRYRRNLMARYTFPKAPYFLMVFPERIYLWTKHDKNSTDDSEPNYSIDAKSIFQPYFDRAGIKAEEISGHSFQLIVNSWLWELVITAENRPENLDPSQRWLVDSGLYAALAGGRLKHEVAA
jgi:hypothetical protein